MINKLLGAAVAIGFSVALSGAAQAACPPGGCPKGYACAGNPIYSTCVKVGKKVKSKGGSAAVDTSIATPVPVNYRP